MKNVTIFCTFFDNVFNFCPRKVLYYTHYSLGSGGKGGSFSWDHTPTHYICISITDFENDIILSEGLFTYSPKVKN